ncbi:unnamed protein product, partial [Brenthis ino]
MSLLIFLLWASIALVSAGNHDIYSGYAVYGIHLKDEVDQKSLISLEKELDVDVWNHGALETRDALVMVSPENKAQLLKILNERDLKYYLHMADVAKSLTEFDLEVARWQRSRSNRLVPYSDYPRYSEVDQYMERIASEYPNLVTLVNAGASFEGRPIKYLKISTSNFTNTSKPIYYMDAAIHAREWVTVPLALYTVHRLVEDLREEDRDLLENVDWIILPIVNPDGYEYSHTDNRLWRRTRSYYPEISTECWGVDANRNFDVNFNTIGVSSNACSDIYPGHQAFSEPETRYVRDIILGHINRIQLYLNVHSYGNYVLFGFGNATLPANAPHLHAVGAAMAAAIDAKKLDKALYYLVGNSNLALYGTSGSAQDYGQAVGVPLSYTLELPGYEYDFRVPPQYIEQINKETWEGIAVSARFANLLYQARNSSSTN